MDFEQRDGRMHACIVMAMSSFSRILHADKNIAAVSIVGLNTNTLIRKQILLFSTVIMI